MFHTWHAGADCINPAVYPAIRANGDKAWFGWPDLPPVEAGITEWFEAADPAAEKAAIDKVNAAAVAGGVYVPTGYFLTYQAWRKTVTGIGKGRCPSPGACPRPEDPPVFGFLVKRVLAVIPVMAVVGLFVFSLLFLAPGDPAALIAGDQASPADIERIRASLGLDRPFLVRFGEWAWRILHGDLGTSIFTNLPVTTMIGQRAADRLLDAGDARLRGAGRGAARRPGGLEGGAPRRPAGDGRGGARLLGAGLRRRLPLGLCLCLELGWLPAQGYTPIEQGIGPWFASLILPSLTLGLVYIALIARVTRRRCWTCSSRITSARAGQGRGARAGAVRPRAEERRGADRHGDRHRHRAAHRRRRRHRDGVRDSRLGRLTVDAILRRDYP